MANDQKLTLDVAELQRRTIAAMVPVSRSFAETLQMNAVQPAECFIQDTIVYRLTGTIWAQELETMFDRVPRDWWEALKERFAPGWFLRRYPVQYKGFKINVEALYPHLVYKTEPHVYKIRVAYIKDPGPNFPGKFQV